MKWKYEWIVVAKATTITSILRRLLTNAKIVMTKILLGVKVLVHVLVGKWKENVMNENITKEILMRFRSYTKA